MPKQPDAPETTDLAAIPATATPPYTVKDGVIETAPAGPANAQADASAPPTAAAVAAASGQETASTSKDEPFNPAAWMHQRIVRQIVEFEQHLGDSHELGGRFVEGPGDEALHITNVASWGPDMILFMGQYTDGRRFELIQHYSQVSVLLVAVPKLKDEPRRIGFELMKAVKDQVHPWGDPIS